MEEVKLRYDMEICNRPEPVVFAKKIFPHISLRKIAKDALKTREDHTILLAGRRVGSSMALALRACYEAMCYHNRKISFIVSAFDDIRNIHDIITQKLIGKSLALTLDNCMVSNNDPWIKKTFFNQITFRTGSEIFIYCPHRQYPVPPDIPKTRLIFPPGHPDVDIILVDNADCYTYEETEEIMSYKRFYNSESLIIAATSVYKKKNKSHVYKWFYDKKLWWKRFHYPCPTSLPGWNEEMDKFARLEMPGNYYQQEILAKFTKAYPKSKEYAYECPTLESTIKK